ncbi:MAG: hypothetical protein E7387_07090 [Ruminococcaceae bacterium]|nr:hypothetical protein [Oscillospiraceae bacterium]
MYTEKTKVREIMHLPGILDIVEKYTKKRINMATLKMGANLTIMKVGEYLHWSQEQMKEVLKELNDLNKNNKD